MNLEKLQMMIMESNYMVCLVGKNIMKKTGVVYLRDGKASYDTEQKYGQSLEEIYNVRTFDTRPELFYQFYKESILANIKEPEPAFYALAELEKMGKLRCTITKEIYDFPGRAGCNRVVNLHGTIFKNHYCPRCQKEYPAKRFLDSGVYICDECNIALHPGTSPIGEMVDNQLFTEAADEVSKADLLLLCGLNLGGVLAKQFLQYYKGEKIVIINTEEHFHDNRADMAYYKEVNEVLPEVVKMIKDNITNGKQTN